MTSNTREHSTFYDCACHSTWRFKMSQICEFEKGTPLHPQTKSQCSINKSLRKRNGLIRCLLRRTTALHTKKESKVESGGDVGRGETPPQNPLSPLHLPLKVSIDRKMANAFLAQRIEDKQKLNS